MFVWINSLVESGAKETRGERSRSGAQAAEDDAPPSSIRLKSAGKGKIYVEGRVIARGPAHVLTPDPAAKRQERTP